MMKTIRRSGTLVLLLGLGLAALVPAWAADTPTAPSSQDTNTAGQDASRPQTGNAPADQPRPAVKAPPPKKKTTRSRRPFRPSEEIHVDKAVDFPADI